MREAPINTEIIQITSQSVRLFNVRFFFFSFVYSQDAGEMVRSFVGGLELIVSLLKSSDREVSSTTTQSRDCGGYATVQTL